MEIERLEVPQGRTFLDWTRYSRHAKACLRRVREIRDGTYVCPEGNGKRKIRHLMREARHWSTAASRMILVRKGMWVVRPASERPNVEGCTRVRSRKISKNVAPVVGS